MTHFEKTQNLAIKATIAYWLASFFSLVVAIFSLTNPAVPVYVGIGFLYLCFFGWLNGLRTFYSYMQAKNAQRQHAERSARIDSDQLRKELEDYDAS